DVRVAPQALDRLGRRATGAEAPVLRVALELTQAPGAQVGARLAPLALRGACLELDQDVALDVGQPALPAGARGRAGGGPARLRSAAPRREGRQGQRREQDDAEARPRR